MNVGSFMSFYPQAMAQAMRKPGAISSLFNDLSRSLVDLPSGDAWPAGFSAAGVSRLYNFADMP
jgi:hypothetical protein